MGDIDNKDIFYCQIETYRAAKDYLRGGRCVRLIAVMPHDFSADALLEGVTTFTVDIDFWLFCSLDPDAPNWRNVPDEIEERDADPGLSSTWLRLEVKYLPRAKNYLYRTFSTDQPTYFDVISLTLHREGLDVPQLPLARLAAISTPDDAKDQPFGEQPSSGNTFVFDVFHVGQGMCSLVHDGSHGVLLDMGAGKPITRKDYQQGKIRNDLCAVVSPLKHLLLVLSHADSDHWRIMGWDPALLKKIEKIYAPVGAVSLAMQDKVVNKNIYGLGNTTWHLNPSTTLRFWRSQPSRNDENGKCLVAVFERSGHQVLAPGDYVYERFKSDSNSGIKALHNTKYTAVVVPHHGDNASGKDVVSPTGVAKAFFSAGTHQSWRHPDCRSLKAHSAAKFNNISNPTQSHIVRTNLI